jgi:hypothetical protein
VRGLKIAAGDGIGRFAFGSTLHPWGPLMLWIRSGGSEPCCWFVILSHGTPT